MSRANFDRAAAALHREFILTDEEVEKMVALVVASYRFASPAQETKCEICGGRHDNDALTDICTSCEARINEEGSP